MANLMDAVTSLEMFSGDDTIFAAPINGKWTPDSPAVVVYMMGELDDELDADRRELGVQHFLGIDVAREVLKVWSEYRNDAVPTPLQATEAVIYYATHNAYPPVEDYY